MWSKKTSIIGRCGMLIFDRAFKGSKGLSPAAPSGQAIPE